MPHRPQVLFPAHARLHPAVSGANVAILTADNPRFPVTPAQGGLADNDALAAELDRLGLNYELTKGRYGTPENSFIVMNPDLLSVLDLGRRAGQESVAWSENGRHQLHYVNGEMAGQATPPAENHTWSDEEPQDNYTAVPGPDGAPYGYFTWNIDFDGPKMQSGQQPGAPAQPPTTPEPRVKPLAASEHPLIGEIRKWAEQLGALRSVELAKADMKEGSQVNVETNPFKGPTWKPIGTAMKAEPTSTDAYFHPSDSSAKKPAPAGPPANNTYRSVPRDYAKGEDAGSAVAMISGDVHKMRKNDMANDTLNAGKHACPGCGSSQSPVVAALRKSHGGRCVKCESGMTKAEPSSFSGRFKTSAGDGRRPAAPAPKPAPTKPVDENAWYAQGEAKKAELGYHNNEPQHGAADNAWKPSIKASPANPGSGGKTTRESIGSKSNPGPASTTFPLKKGSLEAKLGTGKQDHLQSGAPTGTNVPMAPKPMAKGALDAAQAVATSGMVGAAAGIVGYAAQQLHQHIKNRLNKPAPAPSTPAQPVSEKAWYKAEGMPVPSAPKPPQAPGAAPTSAGGSGKPSAPKPMAPLGKGQCECGLKDCHWCKGKKKPAPTKRLHKAIEETISLRKGMEVGGLKAGMMQASAQAAQPGASAVPPIGKVQPKSPAEYDAVAFRPASPGAAGAPAPVMAPSGLELDQTKRTFQAGHKPVDGGNPLSTQPAVKSFQRPGPAAGASATPTLKGGLPIAGLSKVRGTLHGAIRGAGKPRV